MDGWVGGGLDKQTVFTVSHPVPVTFLTMGLWARHLTFLKEDSLTSIVTGD